MLSSIFAVGVFLVAQSTAAAEAPKNIEGWDFHLRVDGTSLLNSNSDVVGQTDGYSTTLGFAKKSAAYYFNGQHEWRNQLHLEESFTRDPSLKKFTKTQDKVLFDSTYIYSFLHPSWLGAYARAKLQTSLFRGFHYEASSTNFLITRRDGSTRSVTADEIKLTDNFKPTKLSQSLGLVAKPYTKTELTAEFFLGAGFEETLAKNQLAVKDDAATAELDIVTLRNVYEIGPNFSARLKGRALEEKLQYGLDFDLLIPTFSNKSTAETRSIMALTKFALKNSLLFEPLSWLKLEYGLSVVREPLIVRELQIAHMLSLKFGYDVVESRSKIY